MFIWRSLGKLGPVVPSMKGNWMAGELAFHCMLFYLSIFMSYNVLSIKKTSHAHTRRAESICWYWDISLKIIWRSFLNGQFLMNKKIINGCIALKGEYKINKNYNKTSSLASILSFPTHTDHLVRLIPTSPLRSAQVLFPPGKPSFCALTAPPGCSQGLPSCFLNALLRLPGLYDSSYRSHGFCTEIYYWINFGCTTWSNICICWEISTVSLVSSHHDT